MNTADQVQLRYGTSAEHAAFTGVQGELTYNTTTKRGHMHDGISVGGNALAFASEVGNARIFKSTGDPNGVIVGKVGDVCVRLDMKVILLKTSGDGTNTGWE